MTTSAAFSVAPTSSTARNTNARASRRRLDGLLGCCHVFSSFGCRPTATSGRPGLASGGPPGPSGPRPPGTLDRAMLLGREQERRAIDRVARRGARAGRSGVARAGRRAGHRQDRAARVRGRRAPQGMQLLRARGVESEADDAVRRPARAAAPRARVARQDPARRRPRRSAGALALGPAAAQDRFAVGAATLSLLAALRRGGPVLRSRRRRPLAGQLERRGAAVRRPAARRRSYRGRPRRRARASRRSSTAPTCRRCASAA